MPYSRRTIVCRGSTGNCFFLSGPAPKPEKQAEDDQRKTDPLGNGKNAINTTERVIPEKFEDKTDDAITDQIKGEHFAGQSFLFPIMIHEKKQHKEACGFDELDGQQTHAVRRDGRCIKVKAPVRGDAIAAACCKAADPPESMHKRNRRQYGVEHTPNGCADQLCGHEHEQDGADEAAVIDESCVIEIIEKRISGLPRQL